MPDPSLIKRHWPFWEMFVKKHSLDVRKTEWDASKHDRQMMDVCFLTLWESYDYLGERSSELW